MPAAPSTSTLDGAIEFAYDGYKCVLFKSKHHLTTRMLPEYYSGSLHVRDTQQAGETTDDEPALVVAERYRERQMRLRLGVRTSPAHELIVTHFGSEESFKRLQAELVRDWDPSANTSTLKSVIFAHIPAEEKLWGIPKNGPGVGKTA